MAKKVLTAADNPKPFKKGHKSKGGRKPSLMTTILAEWKSAGYQRVGKEQVIEAYESLLGLSREELQLIAADSQKPAIITIVAKRMLDTHRGFEAIESMLNRSHGNAAQPIDLTTHDVKDPSAADSIFAALGFKRTSRPGDSGAE